MKKLEAICDAISNYNDYHNPSGDAYAIRNPLLLQGDAKQERTASGLRVFHSHKAGYTSGVDFVQKYCSAMPEKTIQELLENFGITMQKQQESAVQFIRDSINHASDPSLRTNLKWVLE